MPTIIGALPSGRRIPVAADELAWAAIYVAAYVGADWSATVGAAGLPPLAPWNPGLALSLVVLLLRGFRWCPVLLAGGAASAAAICGAVAAWPMALAWQLAQITVTAAAAAALRGRFRIDPDLRGFDDVFRFIAVAAVAATLLVGLCTGVWWLAGHPPQPDLVDAALRHWLSDMIGVTVAGPLLLVHRAVFRRPGRLRALLTWECLAQAAGAVGMLFLIFPRAVGSRFYPMFILLAWVAARHGLPGIAAALMPVQLAFVGAIHLLALQANQVNKLQILMLSLSLTGLLLGAVISERERARASVIEGEARLKAIIDLAPDGMLITDAAGTIEMLNRKFEALCNAPAALLLGRPVGQMLVRAGPLGTDDMMVQRGDGSVIAVETSIATISIGGRRTSVVAVRDITARKQAEARLRDRRSELEHASRSSLTGELAAALAHELNQPLSAILNYTGAAQRILRAAADATPALEQMAKASAQAERAGNIIRRLREFFCNATIDSEPVVVVAMIEDMLPLLADEAVRVGAVFDLAVADGLVARIDRLQIEQVIVNLVRNSLEALAAAGPGEKTVRISARPVADGLVELIVADTGPGIAEEVASRLFTPFTTTRRFGMGLGLSISRSIVQAHGGQLWATGTAPRGAEMHFTVPAAAKDGHG